MHGYTSSCYYGHYRPLFWGFSPLFIFFIPGYTFLAIVDGAKSDIEGDVKVVNDRSAVSNNKLAAGTGNRIDTGLSLGRDVGNDRSIVVKNG